LRWGINLTPYYGPLLLTQLEEELAAVERRYNDLLFAFNRQRFQVEEAKETSSIIDKLISLLRF
jgi:hypothetical protein